jgi:hypothetical protein
MPPFDDLIGWFFKLIIAGVMSFLWWGKREDKKTLQTHGEYIVKLQSQAVTEEKVREIVTDVTRTAITPIHDAMAEIKTLVLANTELTKQMQIKMAVNEGYQQAIKEMKALSE